MKTSSPITPSGKLCLYGTGWILFQLFLLSPLIRAMIPEADNDSLNFAYFTVIVLGVIPIFLPFLVKSFSPLAKKPVTVLLYAAGGLCVCLLLQSLLHPVVPASENNAVVFSLVEHRPVLMGLFTVLLMPIAEECLFRGVLFGGLVRIVPKLAYGCSVLIFIAIHILPYAASNPVTLPLLALGYLPASVALVVVYDRTGTLWASILLHCLLNAANLLLHFF